MYYGSPDLNLKYFSMQFVQLVCTNSFLKKSFISEFSNWKTWHRNKDWSWNIYFLQAKWKGICLYWFFISFWWELFKLFHCCTYFVLTYWSIPPTSCSLDGWFDLIEVVAGTVAPVGTVKWIRFIFLYFLFFFLHGFTFLYLLFSLDVVRCYFGH